MLSQLIVVCLLLQVAVSAKESLLEVESDISLLSCSLSLPNAIHLLSQCVFFLLVRAAESVCVCTKNIVRFLGVATVVLTLSPSEYLSFSLPCISLAAHNIIARRCFISASR